MNNLEKRRAAMLKRVAAFGEKHDAEVKDGSKMAMLFATVKEAVAVLEQSSAAQISSGGAATGGTEAKEAQFDALEALMRSLSRTARSMAADVPGLDSKFRVPRAGADAGLLIAAREQQSGGVSGRIEATTQIGVTIRAANPAVERLDPVVQNKWRTNPAVLADWDSASHTRRTDSADEPEAPPAPPAPTK